MTDKILGAVSLCRKAGKLVMGADTTEQAVYKRQASLVLVTKDLSPRSLKRMTLACEATGVPMLLLPRDMHELAPCAGKPYGIFAICDAGFAKMMKDAVKTISEQETPAV